MGRRLGDQRIELQQMAGSTLIHVTDRYAIGIGPDFHLAPFSLLIQRGRHDDGLLCGRLHRCHRIRPVLRDREAMTIITLYLDGARWAPQRRLQVDEMVQLECAGILAVLPQHRKLWMIAVKPTDMRYEVRLAIDGLQIVM